MPELQDKVVLRSGHDQFIIIMICCFVIYIGIHSNSECHVNVIWWLTPNSVLFSSSV